MQKIKLLACTLDKDLIIQLQQHQLKEQEKLILLLEARITELENNQKKNSSNSSKPPSSDIGKPKQTKSLRTISGKKPGGQTGHSGETLSFSATPNEIITHVVSHCACCGKNISSVATLDFERRQVYDIPPIEIMVTEHQSEIKSCPGCHTINKAVFPEGVNQPVQYGANVQAIGVYFTQYQLLPYARTTEVFKDLFGHTVSQSFLVNNNKRFSSQLVPFIENLKEILLQQPVLHADETGFYYNGNRNWLHTLCTENHSFYMPHTKRGTEAMKDMGILPKYTGILVHDFWKSYNEFSCAHALCNIHHLRDLTFCHEVEKSNWAAQVKQFLLKQHQKVIDAKNAGAESFTKGQLKYIHRKFDALMKEGKRLYPPPKKKQGQRGVVKKSKTHNLLERFISYRSEVLGFTKNFQIPFGNNLAEQAIRMMKIKLKISGCFRSEHGAKDFADTRSYIATMKKQGVDIFKALQNAVQGEPIQLMA